jgi:hypothetical protein
MKLGQFWFSSFLGLEISSLAFTPNHTPNCLRKDHTYRGGASKNNWPLKGVAKLYKADSEQRVPSTERPLGSSTIYFAIRVIMK